MTNTGEFVQAPWIIQTHSRRRCSELDTGVFVGDTVVTGVGLGPLLGQLLVPEANLFVVVGAGLSGETAIDILFLLGNDDLASQFNSPLAAFGVVDQSVGQVNFVVQDVVFNPFDGSVLVMISGAGGTLQLFDADNMDTALLPAVTASSGGFLLCFDVNVRTACCCFNSTRL